LAGEDEAGIELVRLERLAAGHLEVSFDHLRPAPKFLSGRSRSRLAS